MAKQFGRLTKGSTYFFMCDIQAKLVNAVVGYPSVISVARRMVCLPYHAGLQQI